MAIGFQMAKDLLIMSILVREVPLSLIALSFPTVTKKLKHVTRDARGMLVNPYQKIQLFINELINLV